MAPATSVEWRPPRLNQAVIALFIAKSKPRNLTAQAFLVTLREYIRKGRRADVHGSDEEFLDSIALWQNLYDKSQEVGQQLRAKIDVLEQRLETITDASGQTTQSTDTSQKKSKRKNPATATSSSGQATKKAKTTNVTAVPQFHAVQPALLGHGSDLDEEGIKLIHCFDRISEIQQAISKTPSDNSTQKDRACLAVQTAADARRIVLSIHTHTTQNAGPQSKARTTTTRIQEEEAAHTHAEAVNDAENKCKAVIQLFPFLLRTLDTLHEPSETSDLRGQVIHCIIYLFQSLLEHICNLSACEGLQKQATVANSEETGKAKRRLLAETTDFLPAPSAASKSATEKMEDKVVKMLCQLAVAMMKDLDASTLAGQEVFDGFLFFLLLRVGDLLKVFIFGVESPNNVKDVQPEDMHSFHEAQAPYLIFLLRHASSLASQKSRFINMPQTTDSAGSSLPEDAKRFEGISHIANKRLQHTLLKGVFGEQASEFAESLRRPTYSRTECELDFEEQGKRQKECDMAKWFQNEVWDTVGWDVLQPMVAWT